MAGSEWRNIITIIRRSGGNTRAVKGVFIIEVDTTIGGNLFLGPIRAVLGYERHHHDRTFAKDRLRLR